jgi:hypothetical protein
MTLGNLEVRVAVSVGVGDSEESEGVRKDVDDESPMFDLKRD